MQNQVVFERGRFHKKDRERVTDILGRMPVMLVDAGGNNPDLLVRKPFFGYPCSKTYLVFPMSSEWTASNGGEEVRYDPRLNTAFYMPVKGKKRIGYAFNFASLDCLDDVGGVV